jgi:hypothetical protein
VYEKSRYLYLREVGTNWLLVRKWQTAQLISLISSYSRSSNFRYLRNGVLVGGSVWLSLLQNGIPFSIQWTIIDFFGSLVRA